MSIKPATEIFVDVLYTPSEGDKIPQIKRLRAATNCGLKEGKETYEAARAAWGGSVTIRTTAEKYGRMVAIRFDASGREGLTISRVVYNEIELIYL